MSVMKLSCILFAFLLGTSSSAFSQTTQPPPAPTLVAPASGAALVQPITLTWSPVTDPRGPVGNYVWQLGTTSSFTNVIATGFTDERNGTPIPTFARVSGVPNGTYFWRVKTSVTVGGTIGFVDSAFSAVRTVTITGPGPAPGTPSFTAPANLSQFHVREFFDIKWTAVPGAQYYLLEADDDPAFSAPQTLNVEPLQFGTMFHAGWGNTLPNIYYRVRAISIDNVRGLPSATLNVKVVNTAPIPPAPKPLSPIGGATVSLPFTFDWSDTANPQVPGYDVDIDTDPNFSGAFGVGFVEGISRSDYTIVSDLPPGSYFWRVRALHGDAIGPWSAGVSFHVVAAPPTPTGLELAWIITEPSTTYGGASTQARVTLNGPAPAGGATVRIISDMPNVEVPQTVFIPAGATDAMAAPITTPVVHGATVGPLRASFGQKWQQSGLGMFPIVYSLALNSDAVVGGNSLTGTVTLLRPALAGGVTVTLISADTSLVRPPAHVVVPEGETAVSFPIATSPVAGATPITIDTGTANDGFRAPQGVLMLLPIGAPAAAPSLSSVTLASASVLGGGSTTGTVTLTHPAPAGDAVVQIGGSLEGKVVTPPSVTIPAGSTSGTFTIAVPDVNASNWVLIQATYGNGNSGQYGAVLRVDPGQSATPGILTAVFDASTVIGGQTMRGLVGLTTPAPAGGITVFLSSDHPVVSVPASVTIAAGNSATTFVASTSPVINPAFANVTASTAGGSKAAFLGVQPDPNAAAVLAALTPNIGGVFGGATLQIAVTLSASAPAGGAVVTLTSSNTAAAPVQASVTVPAGQGFATFNVTTSAVAADTAVTFTGTYGVSQTATITVMAATPPPPASLLSVTASPTTVVGGTASQGTVNLTSAAPAGGAVVSLTSSNTAVATVPASVTVASGATSATFTVTTVSVTASTPATISGAFGGVSRSAVLTVTAPPPPASLSSLSVSPASVAGGTASQGTVRLTSAAPAGGVVVQLTSSNTAVASVPASVTVASGATSATFTVTTVSVTASTPATISGAFGGVTQSAVLTITPPGQTATLTVTATGRSGESVTSTPAGISVAVGSTRSAPFTTGTSITLTISSGRSGIWSGACSSGGNKAKTCTFTLTGTATVTANVQ
jgi:hypothetical protein